MTIKLIVYLDTGEYGDILTVKTPIVCSSRVLANRGVRPKRRSATISMSKKQLISECVEAFRQGNKQDAARLLPQIGQPAQLILLRCSHHGTHYMRWVDQVIDQSAMTKYSAIPL